MIQNSNGGDSKKLNCPSWFKVFKVATANLEKAFLCLVFVGANGNWPKRGGMITYGKNININICH